LFLIFLARFEATFAACPVVLWSHQFILSLRKGDAMKTTLAKLFLFTQKINRQHVQVALALLGLILFVLGAGAPEGGDPGPH